MEPLRGSRNVYGNAFVRKETDLLRESQSQRDGDASKGRIWKIKNVNKRNPVTGNCKHNEMLVALPRSLPAIFVVSNALQSNGLPRPTRERAACQRPAESFDVQDFRFSHLKKECQHGLNLKSWKINCKTCPADTACS